MKTSPTTASDFADLVEDARRLGEAPISRSIEAIGRETGKKGFRIVGWESTERGIATGKRHTLSSWQPTEEQAVHDAIARAFC